MNRRNFLLSFFLTYFSFVSNGQQISYQSLYDDINFVRQLNGALPVGSTTGQQGVSLAGAATYTIPIPLPLARIQCRRIYRLFIPVITAMDQLGWDGAFQGFRSLAG